MGGTGGAGLTFVGSAASDGCDLALWKALVCWDVVAAQRSSTAEDENSHCALLQQEGLHKARGWANWACWGRVRGGQVESDSVSGYLIHFFSRFTTIFSRFCIRSLTRKYFYVFSDPNINFRTEVRSYPKTVPTFFLKIRVSEA